MRVEECLLIIGEAIKLAPKIIQAFNKKTTAVRIDTTYLKVKADYQ